MTEVLEARRAFDDARREAKALVDRRRAQLGRAMILAREGGPESQSTIASELSIGTKMVVTYEQAYRDWLRDHPGESLD